MSFVVVNFAYCSYVVLKVKLDFSESNLILPESVGNVSLRATTMSPFSDPLMLFVICRQLYQFETPAMGKAS